MIGLSCLAVSLSPFFVLALRKSTGDGIEGHRLLNNLVMTVRYVFISLRLQDFLISLTANQHFAVLEPICDKNQETNFRCSYSSGPNRRLVPYITLDDFPSILSKSVVKGFSKKQNIT